MDNNNPLSPHIQIYSWHISSLVSISHRITGIINILIITLVCFWVAFLLLGENNYEVIKIFNIAKTQPKVIVYENTHLSKADRFSCEKLLESNDYSWKDYDANTLAMKKPLAPQD